MAPDEMRGGVGGCDPHKHTVTVAVIDDTGVAVGTATFDNHPAGLASLLTWLERLGVVISRIGVEGSGSWGLHVAAALAAVGHDVREVPALRTAEGRARRRRPKTDREDAVAIAREVLADPLLSRQHRLSTSVTLISSWRFSATAGDRSCAGVNG